MAMKTEQPFIHQQWEGAVTESRYALLMEKVPTISPDKTVSEFINESLKGPSIPVFSKFFYAQIQALEMLKNISTARLERAFVEHIDCCSYRLDAWKTAIVTAELTQMRNNRGDITDQQRRTGL